MKTTHAIFDAAGAFVRFEELDPAKLPPIPNAADGLPRAVATAAAPECPAGKRLLYGRAGWTIVDRNAAEYAAEVLSASERKEVEDIIENITTIAQDGVANITQANAAIRKIARGLRWQLKQVLTS